MQYEALYGKEAAGSISESRIISRNTLVNITTFSDVFDFSETVCRKYKIQQELLVSRHKERENRFMNIEERIEELLSKMTLHERWDSCIR